MGKRKEAQPWEEAFGRIRVVRLLNEISLPRTTDAELEAVGERIGSQLPDSYRAFMKRFGPGCFEELVHMLPVSALGKRHSRQTIEAVTSFYRAQLGDPRNKRNHEWLFSLVYFAEHENGVAVDAWDPNGLTSIDPLEYCLYRLWRLQEDEPELLAGSLGSYVTKLAEIDIPTWVECESGYSALGLTFRPTFLRTKKTPPRRDVKLWLAFNNHTARDLALAIRDHGRTDAFPILADALQEAGCTNADVLDSCRTGDPDVDGRWVLQVLLGQ